MKTLKITSVLFALLLLSSVSFAQHCDLRINDPNNGGNQTYDYVVELYDFSFSTTVAIETQPGTQIWATSGSSVQINFITTFDEDKYCLYFRAYARNTSNQRWDLQWTSVFDSEEYYNGVPLTLNIP